MNEWDFLDKHFEIAISLSATEQFKYLDSLEIPENLDHQEIKKELLDLLKANQELNKQESFLTPNTTIQSIMGSLKNDSKQTINFKKYSEVSGYIILGELGHGSFGKVYLAEDKKLGRKVALKISPDQGFEAKTLAILEHENIVKVFEEKTIEEKKLRLISLQYVSGPTLETILSELQKNPKYTFENIIQKNSKIFRAFSSWEEHQWSKVKSNDQVENFIEMILKCSKAIEHAHDQEVFHLDLKPGNILINPSGSPMLADFNISKSSDFDENHIMGGTHYFMAPEQLSALQSSDPVSAYQKLDARSDIYSLGKILEKGFEILSYKNPDMTAIINKAVCKNPEDRFTNAHELSSALNHHLKLIAKTKNKPKLTNFEKIFYKAPFIGLMFAALIPHLIGSAINISYNSIRIVSLLTEKQVEAFNIILFLYNIIFLPLGVIFIIYRVIPAFKFLKNFQSDRSSYWNQPLDKMKSKIFKEMPRDILATGSLIWLGCLAAFPLGISFLSEALSRQAIFHLFISIILSWIISVTYSVLFYSIYALRNLSLCFFGGVPDSHTFSKAEFKPIIKRIEKCYLVAATIPMFAALLILTLDPIDFNSGKYTYFRILSAVIIIIGMVGFLTVSRILAKSQYFIRELSKDT